MRRIFQNKYLLVMFSFFFLVEIVLWIDGKFLARMNNQIWAMIPFRFFLSIIMLVGLYLFCDKRIFRFSWKDIGYAISRGCVTIIFNLVMSVYGLIMINKMMINFYDILYASIISICISIVIAIFEEAFARGILTSGMISMLPKTRKNMYIAVISMGLFFGFMHIIPYLHYILNHPINVLVQIIRNVICVGSGGILFGAIYLRVKSIWPCVVVHMCTDVFGFFLQELMARNTSVSNNGINIHAHYTAEQLMVTLSYSLLIASVNIFITWKILRGIQLEECILWKESNERVD